MRSSAARGRSTAGARDAPATLVRSVAADFMCKECVTALAGETRLAYIESPMRLFRQLAMAPSADKLMN